MGGGEPAVELNLIEYRLAEFLRRGGYRNVPSPKSRRRHAACRSAHPAVILIELTVRVPSRAGLTGGWCGDARLPASRDSKDFIGTAITPTQRLWIMQRGARGHGKFVLTRMHFFFWCNLRLQLIDCALFYSITHR